MQVRLISFVKFSCVCLATDQIWVVRLYVYACLCCVLFCFIFLTLLTWCECCFLHLWLIIFRPLVSHSSSCVRVRTVMSPRLQMSPCVMTLRWTGTSTGPPRERMNVALLKVAFTRTLFKHLSLVLSSRQILAHACFILCLTRSSCHCLLLLKVESGIGSLMREPKQSVCSAFQDSNSEPHQNTKT